MLVMWLLLLQSYQSLFAVVPSVITAAVTDIVDVAVVQVVSAVPLIGVAAAVNAATLAI
jgi:hypothetical protein